MKNYWLSNTARIISEMRNKVKLLENYSLADISLS